MRLSDVMRSLTPEGDCWVAQVPDDWLQGRTVFGGLQAAFALHAVRAALPSPLPLRTLQGTFFAPVPGGAVRARGRVLRSGKNTVHAEGQLLDGAQPLCSLTAVFGGARPSGVALAPSQSPVDATQAREFRYVPGLTPKFIQHFDARWLRGAMPFSGSRETEAVIELGVRDAGPATEAHVLALADWIPPLALSWLKTPSPGATMTWMIEMLRERVDDLPLQGWRVDAQLLAAGGGYTSQSLMLWGPGGVPVARSNQSMVVFG